MIIVGQDWGGNVSRAARKAIFSTRDHRAICAAVCDFPILNDPHDISHVQRREPTPAHSAGVMRGAPLMFTKLWYAVCRAKA